MSRIFDDWQETTSTSTIEATSAVLKKKTEDQLASAAQVKALAVDLVVNYRIDDIEIIAAQMNHIFQHPENYLPRTISNVARDRTELEVPYIVYAPELTEKGISPELQKEINLASNIVDDLTSFAVRDRGRQSGFFIGSKNGYFICVDSMHRSRYETFTGKLTGTLDHRERPWYKDAEKYGKVIVTDFYTDITGEQIFTFAMPYYDKEGFAGVAGVDCSMQSFSRQMEDATFGDTNFNIIVSDEGRLLFSSRNERAIIESIAKGDLRKSQDENFAEAARRMVAGETGTAQIKVDDGTEYYLAFAPIPTVKWSFGTLIAVNEVQEPIVAIRHVISEQFRDFYSWIQPVIENFRSNAYLLLIVLFVVMLALGFWLSEKFSRPILELSNNVRNIASGNLDKKIEMHTDDEIEHLAECFNDMTEDLKKQIETLSAVTAEKERIATELKIATGIQEGMLPQIFPESVRKDRFDLFATMHPAKEVGGDFYDFYFVDKDRLIVTIADVSDKGVPAALFMVISKTILKNNALTFSDEDLASIVERANDQLCEGNDEGMFVTVFIAQINLKTGELVYVNAGHNPPLIRRGSNKTFSYLPNMKKSPMLGIQKGIHFSQRSLKLEKDDVLFMYTDGVTEAMNAKRDLFTEERLEKNLNEQDKNLSAEEIIDVVRENINEHVQGAEQSDDITMLTVVLK